MSVVSGNDFVDLIISQYINELKSIYRKHLRQVILFGSYARGDYQVDSDLDIMILVDLAVDRIEDYSDAISELGFEYNLKYDIWISPLIKNEKNFRYWSKADPFYANVVKEGISLFEVN